MFNYLAVRRYKTRLLPKLTKRFPNVSNYSASNIREVVYKDNFSTKLLPLGYMLILNEKDLSQALKEEFPEFEFKLFFEQLAVSSFETEFPSLLKYLTPQTA